MRRILNKINIQLPPLPKPPPAHEASRGTLTLLSVVIFVALIMHLTIANIVVGFFAIAIFILKLVLIRQHQSAPPSWFMIILTVFSVGLILFFYGGWNGQKAGISFLALLVALKFLESRTLRDYYVVCLILYFLSASSFLFNSSIFNILLVLAYTVATTGILLKLSNPGDTPLLATLNASGSIIIRALPLALFLFFFFPRIQGDFGLFQSQDKTNNTQGLSNSLVAGEMAASAFDNSLAFRVEFDGAIPLREQLYWRSKVMLIERNFQWELAPLESRDMESALIKQNAMNLNNGQVSYTILHETSKDFFIPYLDYVAGNSVGRILDDYSVATAKPRPGPFSYQGSSTFSPSLPTGKKADPSAFLQTEAQPSAKMQALLNEWRTDTSSNAQLVKHVYQYFVSNEYNYSLTPPRLNEAKPLEDFLFNTKTGYCEHYASAYTTLMRWLGIPARVVVGYQGGTINQSGDYIEVRYSDAHAWSEVWIDGQWQRIDPTATVSPERIQYGMDAIFDLWEANLLGSEAAGRALSNILNPTGVSGVLKRIRDNWNNLGYQWNKWIVNYNFDTQKELLVKLGIEHRNSLIALIIIMFIGAGTMMLFYFWRLIPKPVKMSQAQRTYLRFVAKFKKYGVVKELADTPSEFADKAIARFPLLEKDIDSVTMSYQLLRYGRNPDSAAQLKAFMQMVKQFKLTS